MVKYEFSSNTNNDTRTTVTTSRNLKTKKPTTAPDDKENLRSLNGDQTIKTKSRQEEKVTPNKSVIKLNGTSIGSRMTVTLNANGVNAVHTHIPNNDTTPTCKSKKSLASSPSTNKTPVGNNNGETNKPKIRRSLISGRSEKAMDDSDVSYGTKSRPSSGFGKTGLQTTLVIKQNGAHGVVMGNQSGDLDSSHLSPKKSQASMLRSGSQNRLSDVRSSIPLARSSSLRSLRPAYLSNLKDGSRSTERPKEFSRASGLRSASQTRLYDTKPASPISRIQSLRSESLTNLNRSFGSQNGLDSSSQNKSNLRRSGSQNRLNPSSKPSSASQKQNALKCASQTKLADSKRSSSLSKSNGLKSASKTRLNMSKPSTPTLKSNALKFGSQTKLNDPNQFDSKPPSPLSKSNSLKSGSQTRMNHTSNSLSSKSNSFKSASQTKLNDSRPPSPLTKQPTPPKPSKPLIKAVLSQRISKEMKKGEEIASVLGKKDVSHSVQISVETKISKKEKKGKPNEISGLQNNVYFYIFY